MTPKPVGDARPTRAVRSRLAGRAAVVAGAILAAAIAFALLPWNPGARKSRLSPADAVEVAVFFPDRDDWEDFRGGARAVADRRLVEIIADTTGSMTLRTRPGHRPIRFAWHGVGGVIETREEARRLAESPSPPVAVVGSVNSLLTAALAVALRPSVARPNPPPLLVPWATAIRVDDPTGGAGTVPLLGIDPGRTFRFCDNNRRLANSVVDCLAAQQPSVTPGRVLLVVDRDDGFSKDLADSFTHAIAERATGIEVRSFALREPHPSRPDSSEVAQEKALATRLWADALDVPGDRATWVVLPLQQGPTLRMIDALRVQGWYMTMTGGSRVQVLCGDSLRAEDLQGLVTRVLPFPVWVSSSGSARGVGRDLGARQVPAEVVSSLVHWVDRVAEPPGSAESLRKSLVAIDLGKDDPGAMGRPLAFDASGERRGAGIGSVLVVEPGREVPAAFCQDTSGRWVEVAPQSSTAVAAPP